MRSRHFLFLVPVSFAMAFSGCNLSENAARSAQNSGVAADNSSALLDLSNNAFGDGRAGGARDRREKALETMIQSKRLSAKLTAASAFFNSLEFQLWKSDGFREDNAAKRDRLIADAVAETLRTFQDFQSVDWSDTAKTASSKAYLGELTQKSYAGQDNGVSPLNGFALSGSLHKISDRQAAAAERYHFKAKSMLDIFGEILLAKKAAESDPSKLNQQPVYVYEGLRLVTEKRELLITLMLEQRLNLMLHSATEQLAGAIAAGKEGEAGIQATAVQLQDAIDKMKAALQVSSLLAKTGIQPRLFADLKKNLATFVADSGNVVAASKENGASPLLPKVQEAREIAEILAQ